MQHFVQYSARQMERFLYEFTIIIYSSLFIISTAKVSDNVVTPPCPPEMSICSFRFLVQYNMTMMSWVTNELGEADVMLPVINGKDGLLYSKRKDCSGQDPLTKEGNSQFSILRMNEQCKLIQGKKS